VAFKRDGWWASAIYTDTLTIWQRLHWLGGFPLAKNQHGSIFVGFDDEGDHGSVLDCARCDEYWIRWTRFTREIDKKSRSKCRLLYIAQHQRGRASI
jgi:hypothetical protein